MPDSVLILFEDIPAHLRARFGDDLGGVDVDAGIVPNLDPVAIGHAVASEMLMA